MKKRRLPYRTLLYMLLWLSIGLSSCVPTRQLPAKQPKQSTAFIQHKRLRKACNEWLGVPYRYGGYSKRGIDCSGLTKQLLKEAYGISVPARSAKDFYTICRKKKLKNLKEGDLVFFRLPRPSDYHVGIYLGNLKFIHATTSKGVRIDNLTQPYYQKSFYKGGSLR